MECSIRNNGTDKHLTARNVMCFKNVMECLDNYDFTTAWWELTDIVSFSKDEDYISVDEAVLLNIGLEMILGKI